MRKVEELLALFQLDPADLRGRAIRTSCPAASSSASAWRGRWRPEPKVLLMDEPFGALDPIIRAKAQDDLLAIQKRFGTTIVLVTHDMEEAIHLGRQDRRHGRGRSSCNTRTPAEILVTNPATAFVETLVGAGERPFRLLSLEPVGEAVEPGDGRGRGDSRGHASQRDALAELLWSGRAGPAGRRPRTAQLLGRVTLEGLVKRAARPA